MLRLQVMNRHRMLAIALLLSILLYSCAAFRSPSTSAMHSDDPGPTQRTQVESLESAEQQAGLVDAARDPFVIASCAGDEQLTAAVQR